MFFFFSFTAHCCFMAILKTSTATNAGQNDRLIHCIKNLRCYNLKSLIFKHSPFHTYLQKYDTTFDLFFVSQSLTNAISLPLIYSISSKHVGDFSARKNKLTFPVQFSPPHPGKGQIPTPGRPCKIKFPTPRAQRMVKCPGFAQGG